MVKRMYVICVSCSLHVIHECKQDFTELNIFSCEEGSIHVTQNSYQIYSTLYIRMGENCPSI